jgi:hypothetical protein
MNLERHSIQSCCGKTAVIFKTDAALTKTFIEFLVNNSFKELAHFTAAGLIYVENSELIITGPIGSDRIQVKCKRPVGCETIFNNFEALLKTFNP